MNNKNMTHYLCIAIFIAAIVIPYIFKISGAHIIICIIIGFGFVVNGMAIALVSKGNLN